MKFRAHYLAVILVLVFISLVIIYIGSKIKSNANEGFTAIPIQYADNNNKIVVAGYYQVDESNMAAIPYGFGIDPTNPTKIIPTSISAQQSISTPKNIPSIPTAGQQMPDGYYFSDNSSLAVLPPNMSPNLTGIDFSVDPSPSVIWTYGTGYISQTQYYENKYKPTNHPSVLPPGVYYSDPSGIYVSVLQYGMVSDPINSYGAISDPNLKMNSALFNYQALVNRNINNNYDVQFHDNIDDIISQNDGSDLSFGEVRVMNQNGDLIVLPKIHTQEFTIYYTPGSFKYGASTYVPSYEDSIYLSAKKKISPSPYDNKAGCSNNACSIDPKFRQRLQNYFP